MKKLTFLFALSLSVFTLMAQKTSQFTNGDFEDTTDFRITGTQGNAWQATGFNFYAPPETKNQFDFGNSGFAPGEGVDGSTALKVVSINTNNNAFGFQMSLDPIDVSDLKHGKYILKFQLKAESETEQTPFWIGIRNDNNEIIGKGGLDNYKGISEGYQEQSCTFEIGRKDKSIKLNMGLAKFDNTYWLDNFELYGPI